MMKVEDILQTADDSVDFGENHGDGWWRDIIIEKASDGGFANLLDSYLENGWEEDSAIGFDRGCITEGHHRLVMAILLCLDEVPVEQYGDSGRCSLSAHEYGIGAFDYHELCEMFS